MTIDITAARALLAQHDIEARGPVSPTQLGLADLVRGLLPVERDSDRPPLGICAVCGRPAGHGPLSDADERLPSRIARWLSDAADGAGDRPTPRIPEDE